MVSPHELSGGEPRSPYSADVALRNIRIGDYYHDQKAKQITEELEALAASHPNLINRVAIELAADKEGCQAGEAALQQREAGLMNSERSKQPGIYVTGHLDYEAFAAMEEQFGIERVPYSLHILDHSHSFAPYELHLPQGAFICRDERGLLDQSYLSVLGAVEFQADGDEFKPIGGGAHFLTGGYLAAEVAHFPSGKTVYGESRLAHGTITRIEGAGGTLWQNPNLNPDGSPRQSARAEA